MLGFGGAKAPEVAAGSNERKRRVEAVQAASRNYVASQLLPALIELCRPQVEAQRVVRVVLDPDAADQQALLIEYASVLAAFGYLRPVVKLELGARSDTEPNESRVVRPYLSDLDGHGMESFEARVRVVAAERTFWDKVALLHEEGFRPNGPRPRLARHYYDIWRMHGAGVADKAMSAAGLFEQVAEHRRTYFPLRREVQDGLVRGRVRLIPDERRMPDWREDFEAMRETMFFGEVPSFDRIIEELREVERRINAPGGESQ